MTASDAVEPSGPGTSTSPADQGLAAALQWMADRLAHLELSAKGSAPDEPQWGPDASESPTDYWRWKHLVHLDRIEKGEPTEPPPTDGPLLSIVVPVYRPSIWYFEECVLSVINQTYQRWELCLCDDGSDVAELTRSMQSFAAHDPRIRVMVMEQNGGISRTTNRALADARGEFVLLLDHDDLLEPDALAEVAKAAISYDDVDIVYTDEDKLDQIDRPHHPQFKPDWDPELLLSYPYLGHLTGFRRQLLADIGGFRPEFDGSQDFDVMLRASERARRVVHIPKVLYHWRVVAGSAAGDPDAKPWAYAASRRVLEDAVSVAASTGLSSRGRSSARTISDDGSTEPPP